MPETKNIAIIPARGGSKRIPHKNIKSFLGRPVLSYSIQAALGSSLFDEVMVSTDDPEIVSVAREYGASVPFLRSEQNANDYATLADVLIEVVRQYEEAGRSFDQICCILPTAPLIAPEQIQKAHEQLNNSSFDSVSPVVAFSYPILRSLELDDMGLLKMCWPEYARTRSQDLKPAYHDSGTFYWIRKDALLHQQTLFPERASAIVLDELYVQDIDTETDWKLAELKYKLMYPDAL